MKINFIAKGLIASSIILSNAAMAWSVSERIVELPQETLIMQKRVELKKLTPHGFTPDIKKKNASGLEQKPMISSTVAENETPVFQKKDASLSIEEQAVANLQRAQVLIKNREYAEAEKNLIFNLNRTPSHHATRSELASLYFKENQLDDAENILLEGLKYDENNSDFLKLMAMIHDKRDEPDKALSLLVKVKESKRQDPSYIAFLGHIYQQTGQYGLARQQYFRLLQMDPKNSMWLLGVSIALDAEGQKDAALEGYHRLTHEGNIDPKILKYVQERINVLKG